MWRLEAARRDRRKDQVTRKLIQEEAFHNVIEMSSSVVVARELSLAIRLMLLSPKDSRLPLS